MNEMAHLKQRKVVIILQARMGSSRLPGKPLKIVMGRPLLSYQIERLRRISSVDDIVIATSDLKTDQPIIDFCKAEHVHFFRGSESDVLDRYYQAAKKYNADVVVRVTGDCPIIDPSVVTQVISLYLKTSPPCDYVSNTLVHTFPRGLDVEVFSFSNLEKAAKAAHLAEEREHVTPYFYLHPEIFSLKNFACEKNLSHHRWTVDEKDDLDLITKILMELYPKKPSFEMNDVLELMQQHPDWMNINAHVQQKKLTIAEKKNF